MKFKIKFLLIALIITNSYSRNLPKIAYKEEVLQGGLTYVASDKNFKQVSLLSTNGIPIVLASPFEFNIGHKIYYIALLGITPIIKDGLRKIEIEYENEKYIKTLNIKKYDFKKTIISLKKEKTKLLNKPSTKRKEQAITLWNIISNKGDPTIYYFDKLTMPIKDSYKKTSSYGDLRVYKKHNQISNSSIHEGNDYGSSKREKTPLFASGRGKVVFARNREISGKTIIIQHLPGVFSLYFHLSKIDVKENQIVNTGKYIGQIGMTGLSTGPHLHLEIRVNGIALNSDFFFDEMLIDKNEIMNHIKEIN